MRLFAAIRYQRNRHPLAGGLALLFLLFVVSAVGMPQRVIHAQDASHESIPGLSIAMVDLDHADEGTPDEPTHPVSSHVHYLSGLSFTLPDTRLALAGIAVARAVCPGGCNGHMSDALSMVPHRPPIA